MTRRSAARDRPAGRRGRRDRAREATETARIAQEQSVAASRIASDLEIRSLDINRSKAIETAEIKKRDAVEVSRIEAELAIDKGRIAASKSREVLQIDQKKTIEIAEEERVIATSARKIERVDSDRAVRAAEINARQEIEKVDITRERELEVARLERRKALEQLDIARNQALQESEIAAREEIERARIASERGLDEARVGRDRDLRKLEVDREREVESAVMDKAIAIFEKSLLESAAQVKAEMAKAKAVEAEEIVKTVRESENAKRRTTVEVMLARKNADEKRIEAEAHAIRAAVDAEAQKLLYEAENALTDEARYGLFRRRLLDRIEGIVRESVKPMEKIEGIRILHVDGLGGMAGNGGGSSRTPTDEVIESALRYRVQAPLIDQVLKEIGIEGGSLAKMGGLMREASDMQRVGKEAQPPRPKDDGPAPQARDPTSPSRPAAAAKARARSDRMARVYVSSVINAPATKVWARVRDFNGLPNWHPGIAESRIENGEPADKVGCVRAFALRNGDRLREKLLGLSDFDMLCTYSILDSPMPLTNYVASLRLTPVTDQDRTFIEWSADFDCAPELEAELVSGVGGNVFQTGFDALNRAFGA